VSFLVDTDTCSAHLKNPGIVTNRFLQYSGRLHVTAITLGELYTWTLRAKAPPKKLQSLLDLLKRRDGSGRGWGCCPEVRRSASGTPRLRTAHARHGSAHCGHGPRPRTDARDPQHTRLRTHPRPDLGGLVDTVATYGLRGGPNDFGLRVRRRAVRSKRRNSWAGESGPSREKSRAASQVYPDDDGGDLRRATFFDNWEKAAGGRPSAPGRRATNEVQRGSGAERTESRPRPERSERRRAERAQVTVDGRKPSA
jgi:hypothetical protein